MPERDGDGSVYDALPDGVVVADAGGVVVDVNLAARRILGDSDWVGRQLGDVLPLIDPQGRDWWACSRPYDGLSSRVRQPERWLTLTREGQPEQTVLVTASYMRGPDRKVDSVVVSLRDTSARTRSERSGAELVSVVAHELRSPLTGVKGFTATLLNKWERFTDEQRLHMLRTINADADRLTRLISELLDVSRIESGRLELHKQLVDLPDLVERDIAGRVAAGEEETRFVVQSAQVPQVWADPDKVRQVVGNIVENALRHGSGTVTIRLSSEGDGTRVSVSDEGEGIAAEALPRIFTKFWRDARRGGTGLGLFIAKGIVEAHGGVIEAGRADSGGASIGFALPVGVPAHPEG
ncbi:MAG TPA: HAMP domain-containing sensor histidine kinase [Mycobacteriales bacterium]|nr:HAMP domain-containing sensor histidine kinase [Mycobacteriales bacterium]